ncbi:MAG TPA: two-component regulator propeller domain-containing protein [Chitinophagaceae bacterium]
MKRITRIILSLVFIYQNLPAQNVFPQKVEGCNPDQFCLDCGDPKANYDADVFKTLSDKLNSTYNFKGGKGKVGFQILVDSLGKGCVLSHTDASNNKLTKDIIALLNDCKWIPAKEGNKAVSSSINVFFEISNDLLVGKIRRVDPGNVNENTKNPGTPEVYNKNYKYSNPSLHTYEITVWQNENSQLPNDMSTISIVDKDNIVWYATHNGFVKFDGTQITRFNESNSPFEKGESVHAIAVDKQNNKWVYANKVIYKYNNTNWEKVDLSQTGIDGAYNIIGAESGEVLFCDDQGLLLWKDNKWELINKDRIKQLPSDKVYYAYKDKRHRLWIGTFSGSIMIDTNNKVTEFNKTNTPINKTCISGATEDNDGNIYFSLYAYEPHKERNRPQEGFAVLTKDEKWLHYNDSNSGLPANHINSILFDRFENVLWIGTNEAGLVRFDLHGGWENYHNLNSKIPSSYIFDLSQDSKGNIYASTFYGMMRIRKKYSSN